MPDTEEVKKTVELDTSGPAMDVDVPETGLLIDKKSKKNVHESRNTRNTSQQILIQVGDLRTSWAKVPKSYIHDYGSLK